MIAVDTNLLVYAHREDAVLHGPAAVSIAELAQSAGPWAIPWPCLHEFIGIVTHPRIYLPPSSLAEAFDQVAAWMESPNVVLLSESEGYWARLRGVLEAGRVVGPAVQDARIAAICLHHGVSELWTADRDFTRFPHLKCRNPLVGRAQIEGKGEG